MFSKNILVAVGSIGLTISFASAASAVTPLYDYDGYRYNYQKEVMGNTKDLNSQIYKSTVPYVPNQPAPAMPSIPKTNLNEKLPQTSLRVQNTIISNKAK